MTSTQKSGTARRHTRRAFVYLQLKLHHRALIAIYLYTLKYLHGSTQNQGFA